MPLLASPSAFIRSSLTAVMERTLPPLVTTLPSFSVVPAWNTCSPNSLACSSPTKVKRILWVLLNHIPCWQSSEDWSPFFRQGRTTMKLPTLTSLWGKALPVKSIPLHLVLRLPSETSSKDTDDTETEIRDPGATIGHITTLRQSKAVLYFVILGNLCRAFLHKITVYCLGSPLSATLNH